MGIVQHDRILFEKSIRAADILLSNKLDGFRSTTISLSYVYGEILTYLAHPSCRKAFLSGTDGAITLTQEELDGLNRLRWAFFPSYCDCTSLEQMEARATEASHIVAAILSASNTIVDKKSNLRGHEVLALLDKVKHSDFFSAGPWPVVADDANTDPEVVAALPPIPESPNESDNLESLFIRTDSRNSGSFLSNEDSSSKSDGTELAAQETLKSMVNSVVLEETVGDQTSVSSPLSAPTTETNDDHNDSANVSDSGNGTVSPDCEVVPDTKTEPKRKPNNVVKEKKKYRGYYRSGETGTHQGNERERYDQRSYSANRIQNGGNNTSQTRQGSFQTKRTDRVGQYSNTGAQDSSHYSEHWRSDNRMNGSRSDRFSNYQSRSSFTYEPGISRRPGPTTIGFIFAGK
ncbi:hypothetical protein GCK32_015229 [Trichostrongylus colubriformis]|uniref:Caprin-1 dimerization domain-containing protein n=1 Tax=Trichostrongylus colubriformis TaxID=6319 RepID=A0AAN8IZZ1_TRICO